MTGWGLANVNGTADVMTINTTVVADIANSSTVDGPTFYWVAPDEYLGNRVC